MTLFALLARRLCRIACALRRVRSKRAVDETEFDFGRDARRYW